MLEPVGLILAVPILESILYYTFLKSVPIIIFYEKYQRQSNTLCRIFHYLVGAILGAIKLQIFETCFLVTPIILDWFP